MTIPLDRLYMGPGASLERFEAGAIVTADDFICDESEWVLRDIHPAKLRRLRYMLDNVPCCIIAPDSAEETRGSRG